MPPLFRPHEAARVRELLAELERPVELLLALGPEETPLAGVREIDFAAETRRLCEELVALSTGRLSLRVEERPPGFERFPSIDVRPEGEDAGVRYDGLPWGYELSSLVGAIREAGLATVILSEDSLEALAALKEDVAVDVFVTPT